MMEVMRLSYEKSINLLKAKGVEFEAGLTDVEMGKIESTYKIEFPKSLKIFLMTVLPVSRGFYNWRNFEEDNIRFIKMVMNRPIEDVCELAEEIYWCDDWGEKPKDEVDIGRVVRNKLKNAPILLPIYGHRYIPVISVDNLPVISVHGIDIIYYGQDLEDYFEVEFGAKEQEAICFENFQPISFWTDII